MSATNKPTIQGLSGERDTDRIGRHIACLVLAELPTAARRHPATATCDLVEQTVADVCRSYGLEIDTFGPGLIERVLAHLGSYFPEAVRQDTSATPVQRQLAGRVSFMDQLDPIARSALLQRIHADFDPAEDLRSEIEQQIARHERLYGAIRGSVRRALHHYGGIRDYAHADPHAWENATFDDLVAHIMTNIRAGLSPVFSDVIVKEAIAFDRRHRS